MIRVLLAAVVIAAGLPVPAGAGDGGPAYLRKRATAAEEPLPAVTAFPTPLAGTVSRVLAALALISGAAAALVWWSRKQRGPGLVSASRIRVLASRAIGPRHQVVLIEVGERRLLLGTAPESVRALADLSEVPPFAAELDRHLPEAESGARADLNAPHVRLEGLDV